MAKQSCARCISSQVPRWYIAGTDPCLGKVGPYQFGPLRLYGAYCHAWFSHLSGNFFQCFTCTAIDVLSQGAWKELNGLVDPELKQLADSLPKVVLAGRAPATVRKYSGAFGRWKKWVDAKQGIAAMPASPSLVLKLSGPEGQF